METCTPPTYLIALLLLSFCNEQIAQRATGDVQIDRSVWKAHENMPLKNVYLLFANLRCIRLFIISGDRLTGIISRSILFNVRTLKCMLQPVFWPEVVGASVVVAADESVHM